MRRFLSLALAWSMLLVAANGADLSSILAPPDPAPSSGGKGVPGVRSSASGARWAEEKDVLTALTDKVSERFPTEGELRLSFSRPWGRLRLPDNSDWQVVLTEVPPNGLTANMNIRFAIRQGDRQVGEWSCLMRAQLWRAVWQATQRLEKGGQIDSSLCSSQTIDVLRESQAPVPASTNLANYELVQTVSSGRSLTWRDLVAKPLIRKGEMVEVIAGEGALSISTKALAMTNGAAGEIVTLRNLDSKREFQARVIKANTAQVAF